MAMAIIKRYPRSFLQLVTFGHVMVALPLLVATWFAFLTLDLLAERYQMVVENVAAVGRLSGELAEDVVHMERNLRRHQILQNHESLNDYEEVRAEWRKHFEEFSAIQLLPTSLLAELRLQVALEEQAHQALSEHQDLAAQLAAIEEIRDRWAQVQNEVGELLKRDQQSIRLKSDTLLKQLVVATVAAGGLAALFLWLVRRLLARLIGRFERAVLGLGRGDLETPILLEGPGDLRWLGRWLEWLRKRLMSLESERVQVLRHVSHELKTPLTAIQEGAALLADQIPGPLTAEQGRLVSIVQSNVGRLQALIDGLLRLQQAGHTAERIGFEPLAFDEIVGQVVETQRLIAQERRIEFQVDLQPVEIIAGREALVTIVHNLLSNAVKFSPPGSRIDVVLRANDDQALLRVEDQGPGITEKDMPRLFEPFYRGSAAHQVAGVGLGLAITREFVRAHRGEVTVANLAGGGARFQVVLPLRAPFLRRQENG